MEKTIQDTIIENQLKLKEAKYAQIKLLQQKKKLQEALPHLYSYPFYNWARKFFESTNRVNLLCAANQISKSSTQIRKCIHWCTNPDLWPKLWKTRPRQFWYLYPSRDVIGSEFKNKWEPEFMPRQEVHGHPQYGWKPRNKQGIIDHIEFNTGVTLYFKAYSQDVHHLQSGTVHGIFTDEEMPVDIFDELMFRLAAVDGHFHMVFTATRGQDFWRRAIERVGCSDEALTDAFKIQVSMYDCLRYEDGSKTPWTKAKIEQIKRTCKSDAEVQRRVYGKFVLDEGLKYPCFNRDKNVVPKYTIPKDWHIYTGVDIGSGGSKGHPAAICFVAVKPDYKKGVVFKGWIGGKTKVTTSSDILDIYRMLRGSLKPIIQSYDWSSKDFHTYASRLGETFVKAEKSHDIGEDIINVLFNNGMLEIFDIPELAQLPNELTSLLKETNKKYAKDDFTDAMRYAVTNIPWDWSAIADDIAREKKKPDRKKSELEKRRELIFGDEYAKSEYERVEDEIEMYNELFEY